MTSRRDFLAGSLTVGFAGASGLAPVGASFAAASDSEWLLRPPADEGLDAAALQQVLDDARLVNALRSVLVVKNGALIAEQYYGGATPSDLQSINSATKSVASMLVGIALQQGKIKSLSATIDELLPEAVGKSPGSAAHAITLEQILTGTTGLVYDYQTQFREFEVASDPIGFTMGLPVDTTKPTKWVYNDAAVALLSPILMHAYGLPLDAIAKRDLFDPLGITRFDGARDKAGNVVSYKGLRLCARDFAKIAWTMTNEGRWGDVQVVPADWVKRSTTWHVTSTWSAAPMRGAGYGLLWFTGELGGRPVAWAWGYGAQFAMVVPSLRLALTTTARSPNPSDLMAQNAAVMGVVAQIVALAG